MKILFRKISIFRLYIFTENLHYVIYTDFIFDIDYILTLYTYIFMQNCVFHLHNASTSRELNVTLSGRRLRHDPNPELLGLTPEDPDL